MYEIVTVLFNRTKDAPLEPGIMFDNGVSIVDVNCKEVDGVYDYQVMRSILSIDVSASMSKMKRMAKAMNPDVAYPKPKHIPRKQASRRP